MASTACCEASTPFTAYCAVSAACCAASAASTAYSTASTASTARSEVQSASLDYFCRHFCTYFEGEVEKERRKQKI